MKFDDFIRKTALADNTLEQFQPAKERMKDLLDSNERIVQRVFNDSDFGESVIKLLLKRVYEEIREQRKTDRRYWRGSATSQNSDQQVQRCPGT